MSHDNKVTVNTTLNNVVIIDSEQNQISVSHPVTQVIEVTAQPAHAVTVIEETPNRVTVNESDTRIIYVSSVGPQGIQGLSVPFTNLGNNTWNTDNNIQITGSLTVSDALYISSSNSVYINGNRQFNYGAFYDTTTQSGSANVSQSFQYNTTSYSNGVTITNNSRITVLYNGIYNIQFSAQVVHDGNQTEDIWIWLKKNGINISNSATRLRVTKQEHIVASWNFVEQINTTDYIEITWQSPDNDMRILAEPATGNIPAIPSLILTVTQVA